MTIMRTLITKYTPDEFVSINEFNQEIGEYWYVLGAYASDGYVCNSGISIEVRESDAVWLKKLDSVIHSWFGLTGHWSQRVVNSHKYCRLRHHSILLSQYFSKLGIYQAKSHTIDVNPNLNDMYLPHFVLGYFDGNGWISWRRRKIGASSYDELACGITSGSILFLRSLQDRLGSVGYYGKIRKCSDSKAGLLEWSSSTKAQRVLEYLYATELASCWLPRKYQKLQEWQQRECIKHPRWWTPESVQYLVANYSNLPINQIATVLNRTPRAVSLKARRLNLLKAKGVQ